MPYRDDDAPTLRPAEQQRRFLLAMCTSVAGTLLAAAGFTAGVFGGMAASWLGWLWQTGAAGMAAAAGILLLFFPALFFGCRAAAYGMQSRLGAALPALGWTLGLLVLTGYTPDGSVLVSAGAVNYVFLLGGVLTVTLATVSVPPPRSPR